MKDQQPPMLPAPLPRPHYNEPARFINTIIFPHHLSPVAMQALGWNLAVAKAWLLSRFSWDLDRTPFLPLYSSLARPRPPII